MKEIYQYHNSLQNSSGNFKHFIQKAFNGSIPYYANLTINILMSKFVTTSVLKGILIYFFHEEKQH